MVIGKLNRDDDLRKMLLSAGLGEMRATLAIPYMYFLPRASDPYTQGVMAIVEGLQRLLRDKGAPLALDSGLGAETAKYLGVIAPNWNEHTWAGIYGAVLSSPHRFAASQKIAMSGLGATGALSDSPVAWLFGGAAIYWLFLRDDAAKARARKVGRSARGAWDGARKEWR